ncbi:MAG: hypothetical protein CMJ48_04765 [Planctomycetaceae bacterium]|nr:hypothetical protein [Planctomycetaceae bacterium]
MSRRVLQWCVLAACSTSVCFGQGKRGYNVTVDVAPPGEERRLQRGLWDAEVSFKSMRMIESDVKDAKGNVKRELFWYLCYRIVRRPIEQISVDVTLAPENTFDKTPESVLAPEFALVTDDNGSQETHPDEILPQVQRDIEKREKQKFNNSVEIVGALPATTPLGATTLNAKYGVAIWRGVDLRTDRFKVFMTGLSNGYKIGKDPDGAPLYLRKTLVQEYWRPGDRFNPSEREIRAKGDPVWLYRADPAKRPAGTPAAAPAKAAE